MSKRSYLSEGNDRWLYHPDGKPCAKLSFEQDNENFKFYPCVPEAWLWLPKWARAVLGHITLGYYCFQFLVLPLCLLCLIPRVWAIYPLNIFAATWLASVVMSYLLPRKEWLPIRYMGQLWYELLDFKCNLTRQDLWKLTHEGDWRQYMICMYPHGIIPITGPMAMAYWDQYMSVPKIDYTQQQYIACIDSLTACTNTWVHNEDGVSNALLRGNDPAPMDTFGAYAEARKNIKGLYGFGAVADVVAFLPFLRNMMGWYGACSAGYKCLLDGLKHGRSSKVNPGGRTPKHGYILAGGVAEVYCSTPNKHAVKVKNRYGLIRLALATGANLMPWYVFGASDLFYNLATYEADESSLDPSKSGHVRRLLTLFATKFSKRYRMGVTWWWGEWGSPVIPFKPKLRLAIGRPIPVKKWKGDPKHIDEKLVEDLHKIYVAALVHLFDSYKAAAGYPDAQLEIL